MVVRIPVIGPMTRRIYFALLRMRFAGSDTYWEKRYRAGGTSGAGSYARLARFKADVLNGFVRENGVRSVIELGCGDGAQLALADYPAYVGVDVSETALRLCRERFARDPSKRFVRSAAEAPGPYDLALSLDVIYHLVEDEVFETYMQTLFASAARFVAIYASNFDRKLPEPHVRHRQFDRWIAARRPDWQLMRKIDNPYPYDRRHPDTTSFADFYLYGRLGETAAVSR